MIERHRFHGEVFFIEDQQPVPHHRGFLVGDLEGFRQFVAPGFHLRLADVRHAPGGPEVLVEVPQVAAETVVEDFSGSRWTPDPVLRSLAGEVQAEEPVEARHVVHVEVRKEDMVDRLHLRRREHGQTAFAAVEKQPAHGVTAVDLHMERIVPPGRTEHPETDRHAAGKKPRANLSS